MREPTILAQLIWTFKEVWEWYRKDEYIVQAKDFKHAKEYLAINEFKKELIQQRAKIYMQREFYEKCGWNFSAFITNIAQFVPDKWRCTHCQEWFSGNVSKKNHEEECSKNQKFNVETDLDIDVLLNKFKI